MYQPRAAYLISEAWTDFTIRSMTIRPRPSLSHTFYRKHPQEFYRFYRDKMLCLDAEPNITHYKLAELEKAGKLKGVVTQNIDGLHQKAGSKM